MKLLSGDRNRDDLQQTIYKGGGFTYEYVSDFARGLPPYLTYASVSGGCVDGDDNVYLAVRDSPSPIVKLDSEGRYVKDFGAGIFKYIHFINITRKNTLLGADVPMHVIRELTPDGELIRDFGTIGVPSDSGYDHDIWRKTRRWGGMYPTEPEVGFDEKWAFYEALRTIRRAAPPFNSPTDAGMNSKGEYFFSDGYGNAAVHKFGADGKLAKTWGGVGSEPGKFTVVHSLAVDRKDRVWVCDRESDAVHVFDGDGNVLAYCKGNMGQPSGVDCDDEYVYVVGRAGYLTIFDANMDIVAQLGTFNSDLRAHDICVNSRGDLFLFPTHANEDHQIIRLRRVR